MAVAQGVENVPWLFTGTLVATLLLHPVFAAAVSRWTRRRFVTITYRFFMASLVAFFLLVRATPPEVAVWVTRAFFVWVAVFGLFVVSVFWSFMTDIFGEGQGRRLFGVVAVGGTLGGIAGSSVTAFLATELSPAVLLLVPVVLLECAVLCVKAIDVRVKDDGGRTRGSPSPRGSPGAGRGPVIGGSWMDGIRRVLSSPYLLGICAFMLLYTIGSTFLYFIQLEFVAATFADNDQQTAVFARMDLAVNVLVLFIELFFTGRIMKKLGVGLTLALLPLLCVFGFLALSAVPVFAVFVVFQVLRRTGEYAVSRPTREVLYTVLSRSDKYKAKNFNDTFVYRSGDQIGAWSYAAFAAMGLGTSALALLMVPLSALWLVVGLWLGKEQKALAKRSRSERPDSGHRLA